MQGGEEGSDDALMGMASKYLLLAIPSLFLDCALRCGGVGKLGGR